MQSFRAGYLSLSRPEKWFIFFSMIVGFCISAEYGIIRPVSQCIFLTVFSASAFPILWLATVPVNFAIVYIYNHFLPRLGPLRMMGIVVSCIISINILCFVLLPLFPRVIFFHACWKDVYILLMFKQLWSMVHSTLAASRAKYIFGAILGVGTSGAALGALIPGYFASMMGSSNLLVISMPIYIILYLAYCKAYRFSGSQMLMPSISKERFSASEGFRLIARSRYIFAILLLVMFMQVSMAFVEFQFNHQIELLIPSLDMRTAYLGRMISIINIISLVFQFIGGYFLIQMIGLRNSHFLIPLVLFMAAIGQWMFPCFALTLFSYGLTKSMDYSLFTVLREILFVPLRLDEKYRAKAVIDVFAHRTSKALASLLLLGLQLVVGVRVFSMTNYLLFAVFIGWLLAVRFLFKKAELQEPVTGN
jgi:ATP/ADP translocase